MPKNPFDNPYDHASRWLREFGGRSAIEEILRQDRRNRELLDPPMVRAIKESAGVLKQYQDEQLKVTQALALFDVDLKEVTRQAELFQREIARTIGPQIEVYERQVRELYAPMGGLAAALEREQRAITSALSVFSSQELAILTGTAGEALRQHYAFLAETAQFGVEGAEAAFEVVEALDTVNSDAQSGKDVPSALINALVKLLVALVQNTSKRIQEIDLIEILIILATIQSLQPDYTEADRKRDKNTFGIVQRMEEQVKQVAAARAAQNEYVKSLPKAVNIGAGRVRETPNADAKILYKLPKETVVAIAEKHGRWRRVIYEDQLNGDLAQGWIWSNSVNDLND